MANYYNEISMMMETVMHKIEIMNRSGLRFGKKKEKFNFLEILILRSVKDSPRILISELVNKIGVDRGVVTTCINKLCVNGYMGKEKSEIDGRRFHMSMTEKGEALYEAIQAKEDDLLKFILDEITINEAKAILKFLSKINQTTVEKFELDKKNIDTK